MQVPIGSHRRSVAQTAHQVINRRARGSRQRLTSVP
jgi:hypothetical protein